MAIVITNPIILGRCGGIARRRLIGRLAMANNKITHEVVLCGAIAKRWLQTRFTHMFTHWIGRQTTLHADSPADPAYSPVHNPDVQSCIPNLLTQDEDGRSYLTGNSLFADSTVSPTQLRALQPGRLRAEI